jgi:hypothetical protein
MDSILIFQLDRIYRIDRILFSRLSGLPASGWDESLEVQSPSAKGAILLFPGSRILSLRQPMPTIDFQ